MAWWQRELTDNPARDAELQSGRLDDEQNETATWEKTGPSQV